VEAGITSRRRALAWRLRGRTVIVQCLTPNVRGQWSTDDGGMFSSRGTRASESFKLITRRARKVDPRLPKPQTS